VENTFDNPEILGHRRIQYIFVGKGAIALFTPLWPPRIAKDQAFVGIVESYKGILARRA
jgi:hypothetical protein